MKALFVTNGSASIGGGHVMRCLTLAETLRQSGDEVVFAVNREASTAAPALARSGFPIETMAHPLQAGEATAALGGFDVIICDSYDIDAEIEAGLRAQARAIVVIDDLADRPHDCDLLIDSTYGRAAGDYAALVPARATVLTGAAHALLRAEFAAARKISLARRARADKATNLLVSLGLTDVRAITARVVAQLIRLERLDSIAVVIGPHAESRAALERLARSDPRLRLHVDPPDMARLMAEADVAVGAAGATSWERCCLGLPSLLIVLADNQRLVAKNLVDAGAALDAVDDSDDDAMRLASRLRPAMEDRARLAAISRTCAQIVDGAGARRVAEAIRRQLDAPLEPARPRRCRLRPATPEDARFLFDLRNDPVTRAASHQTAPLDWAAHEAWFSRALSDPRRRIFIGERAEAEGGDSDPRLGMVRADREEAGWLLSWIVAPARRGCGAGADLVTMAVRSLHDSVRAEVKAVNVASARIAERAGLTFLGARGGILHYGRRATSLANPAGSEAHDVA